MKRLIVYDLDGTLVDTLDDIVAAANHTMAQLKLPPIERDEVRRYVGRGLRELVQKCLDTDDESLVTDAMRIYRKFYGQHMLDHSRPYPGVTDVLNHFRNRRQAVLTNKPDPYATQMVQALGLAPFFASIIAGDTCFPKKPNPASMRALIEEAGASAEEVILIGDSTVDIETARHVGAAVVAVCHGLEDKEALVAAKPDRLVADFRELLALARAERW